MIYYIPAFCIAVAIFLLSTVFGAKVPNPIPELISPDKLGHLVAYFGLATSLLWGLDQNKRLNKRSRNIAILACALYGIGLEIVQYAFFPDRYFEWWDMLANLVGAILATLIIHLLNKSSQNG